MRSILLFALTGCGSPWVEDVEGDWRSLVATMTSNGSGNIKATVKPLPGETNLLIGFQPLEADRRTQLRFLSVDGEQPYRSNTESGANNPFNRSSAAFLTQAGNTSFNWPSAITDGSMSQATHKFTAGVVDSTRQYTKGTARVGVLLKSDPDLSSGLLRVNLVYGGATVNDSDLMAAVDGAVQIWRDIYANSGIQLDVVLFESPYSRLQAPSEGSFEEYEEIARSTRFGAVNVVILEEIEGFPGALGFAGSIPGPLISTSQSAVAVNVTLGAGTDGRFTPLETTLLGETMAHEVGHFLGLYHPVEGRTWDQWDALDDTVQCEAEVDCVQSLGDNLMFPFPICDNNGCLPQQTLTPEQGGIANRYTGVL